MKPTLIPSEKKSTSLPKPGNTDFWKFYLVNKGEIDRVIHLVFYKYSRFINIEEGDFRSEILYRLCKSNVLESYDHNRASLMTYVIGRIHGYASHIVRQQMIHGYGNIVYRVNTCRAPGDSSLEPILENSQEDVEDLRAPEIESLLDTVDRTIKIEKLQSKLPDELRMILKQLLDGYNNSEIGNQIGVSSVAIGMKVVKIKDKARYVFKDEI